MALRAGPRPGSWSTLATRHGVRLACSPATFLGEAQQTAAASIRRAASARSARSTRTSAGVASRAGTRPRAVLRRRRPGRRRRLSADAGHDDGRARRARSARWGWDLHADRTTVDGTPFRIGSPDLIVAALELDGGAVLRLTASFYVGRPGQAAAAASSSTATTRRSRSATSRSSTRRSRSGRTAATTSRSRSSGEPFRGIAWARGVADMAAAIGRAGPTGQRRAGGPRRRHPRRRRALDGRRRAAGRGDLVVRAARAHAMGRPAGVVTETTVPTGPLDPTPEVLRLVDRVLGANVIGAYAHGSVVLGRLRPLSDVDVLVVARRRTTDAERRALVDGLLRISGRWPSNDRRPVELTVVAQPDVRPWRYPPVMDLQFGEWLRAALERGVPPDPPSPTPDLAPVLAMVLAGNRPLLGPPPAEVLDPVPPGDLRLAMRDVVPGLLHDLDGDERNVILTLARIWTRWPPARSIEGCRRRLGAGAAAGRASRRPRARADRVPRRGRRGLVRAGSPGASARGPRPPTDRLVGAGRRVGSSPMARRPASGARSIATRHTTWRSRCRSRRATCRGMSG